MNEKTIIVTDENGKNTEYEIILTFESPITGKKYVIYQLPDEEEEVMAAIYEEENDGEGNLIEIETEEEFQMIQDILDSFMEEEEEEEEEE